MRDVPKRMRVILLVGAGSLCLLGAQPSAEQVLTNEPADLAKRLDREKLIVLEDVSSGGSESFVIAYLIFERRREEVIELLRLAERQTEYRPELDSVKTVRKLENGRIDEQHLRILFTEIVYRLRYVDVPGSNRFDWKLDPDFDNDLRRMEGFWELSAYHSDPNRTLARFGSNVDVGPAVPRVIQKGMSRRTVLRYLENCRRWIDSNGEWRP
jgi:hypothetical protein